MIQLQAAAGHTPITDRMLAAYEELQFASLAESSPVHVALLWGNPETGPAAVMVRFPEGYREPWHSHSSTYRAELNAGAGESLAMVYLDGPVDFVPAE